MEKILTAQNLLIFIFISIVVLLVFVFFERKKTSFLIVRHIYNLINGSNDRHGFLTTGDFFTYIFDGTYKGYKIFCSRVCWGLPGYIIYIYAKPKSIPKKIPILKFVPKYPVVYKDVSFLNNRVSISFFSKGKEEISAERAKELLDDLITSCQMVERGEYEV